MDCALTRFGYKGEGEYFIWWMSVHEIYACCIKRLGKACSVIRPLGATLNPNANAKNAMKPVVCSITSQLKRTGVCVWVNRLHILVLVSFSLSPSSHDNL
jgi:hypothetical protein